jgi:hypothetical protein
MPAVSIDPQWIAERAVRKAYDDGVETGGLPGGDVARAVVKEHLRCEGATTVMAVSISVENRSNMREQALWFRFVRLPYRSLGVELGDLDDSFHGLQRGLAQDSSASVRAVV